MECFTTCEAVGGESRRDAKVYEDLRDSQAIQNDIFPISGVIVIADA